MRIFKEPNLHNDWKCPICNTNDKKEVVLIGIVGTEDENIIQAEQFHLECLDLFWYKEKETIYQFINKENNAFPALGR